MLTMDVSFIFSGKCSSGDCLGRLVQVREDDSSKDFRAIVTFFGAYMYSLQVSHLNYSRQYFKIAPEKAVTMMYI